MVLSHDKTEGYSFAFGENAARLFRVLGRCTDSAVPRYSVCGDSVAAVIVMRGSHRVQPYCASSFGSSM